MSTVEEHTTQINKSPLKTPQTHTKNPEANLTSVKKVEELNLSIKKSVVDKSSVPVSPLKSAVKQRPEEEVIALKEVEKSGKKSESKGKSESKAKSVSKKSKKEEKKEEKEEVTATSRGGGQSVPS